MTISEILIIVILAGVITAFLYTMLNRDIWEATDPATAGDCPRCGENHAPVKVSFEGFEFYRCDDCDHDWVYTPDSIIWWSSHRWY